MKIKYLKVMHNANIGDELDVTDFEANILIKAGVAELAEEQPTVGTVEAKLSSVIYTPIDTHGLLLNLNGTPVVNDFGELVAEKQVVIEEKPKTPRKPRSNKTKEQE